MIAASESRGEREDTGEKTKTERRRRRERSKKEERGEGERGREVRQREKYSFYCRKLLGSGHWCEYFGDYGCFDKQMSHFL